MTVTVSFQPTGSVPANAGPVTMRGHSMTIGRGPANDLVLPDPERMLSKSHCVIEDQGGNVVVVDLSTNGTFLNYAKIPLGPVPTPLNNGDVLTLGAFELVVAINAGAPSALDLPPDPLADPLISHGQADNAPDPLDLLDAPGPDGDVFDDLLGAGNVPTGPSQINPVDPIDALLPDMGDEEDPFFGKPATGQEEQGGSFGAHSPSASDSFAPATASRPVIPDDWDDLLEPGPDEADDSDPFALPPVEPPIPAAAPESTFAPTPAPQAKPDPDVFAPPPPVESSPVTPAPVTPAPAVPHPTAQPMPAAQPETGTAVPAPPVGGYDATKAFLEALGVDGLEIPDEELAPTMARAGAIMRVLVSGIRDILMTRTSIKSEFRIEQTMIGAGGNNPLKFSVSPDQAIEVLLRPRMRGYLPPEEAAREALDDIAAHEVAMVAGMETAIKAVLSKLAPDVLADQIETSGKISGLLRGRKAQYWDVYEKMYAEISDQAENDFHHFFSREFARAYQDQLNRLKDN